MLAKDFPTEEMIESIWYQYAVEEKSSVASEIELLSKNQRKLLTILSRTDGTGAPLGQEFVQQANMSKTTIEQSLKILKQKMVKNSNKFDFANVHVKTKFAFFGNLKYCNKFCLFF